MPEIGRLVNPQEQYYHQVQMAPKNTSQAGKSKSEKDLREDIINKATGYKPKNEVFKEGPHNQMGKDEFMKLLTVQLQHQDPMNPMDQSKLTGELAQFSQLEQLTNLNKKYDNTQKNQGIQDKFYAASFVGKKVVTSGSSLELKNSGDPGDVLFKLDGDASKVLVRILDEKNNVSGEIWREGLTAGSHQVTWDGVALDGSPAVKGKYRIQVKAWDDKNQEVTTRTEATGIVQSVAFDEGEPVLTVNGQKVYLRDVGSFHTAETNTHAVEANTSTVSGQVAPVIESSQVPVPVKQAMNAYAEQTGDAGIYD